MSEKRTVLPPVKKVNVKITGKLPPLIKKISSKQNEKSSVLTKGSSTNMTTKSSLTKDEEENKDSQQMNSGTIKEKESPATPKKTLLKRPVISASTINKLQSSSSQNSLKHTINNKRYGAWKGVTPAPAPTPTSSSLRIGNKLQNSNTSFNSRNNETDINKKTNEIKVDDKNKKTGYHENSPKRYNFDLKKKSNLNTSTEPKSLIKNTIKYTPKIDQSEKSPLYPSTKTFSTTISTNAQSNSNNSFITNTTKQLYSTDTFLNTTDDAYSIQMKKKELIEKSEEIKRIQKQNLEDVTQTNNKVMRRTKTIELQEYECNFLMDAPLLFCEKAYGIKSLSPVELKCEKIKLLLENHKNEIIQILKVWIENDKSCSALMKKIMSMLIEGDNSVLEQLKGNKQLAEDIFSRMTASINEANNLNSVDYENIPEDNNNT